MARSAARWVSVRGGAWAIGCSMCAVRVSGRDGGAGTGGAVGSCSPVVGPVGGVVMAGVLAHHLQMVEGCVGKHV